MYLKLKMNKIIPAYKFKRKIKSVKWIIQNGGNCLKEKEEVKVNI